MKNKKNLNNTVLEAKPEKEDALNKTTAEGYVPKEYFTIRRNENIRSKANLIETPRVSFVQRLSDKNQRR